MEIYKGDIKSLYCEFKEKKEFLKVKKPRVRVLHEEDGKVYEILSWKDLTPLGNGYIYSFDTNICKSYGKYVSVFEGIYKKQKLNVVEEFDIVVKNVDDTNAIYIYGYINDIDTERPLQTTQVSIKNLDNNEIVFQTLSDVDGKWEAKILPGDYEFIFNCSKYIEKSIRAQVGDENKEIQFNNVSLEQKRNAEMFSYGIFCISDSFVTKNNLPIQNVEVKIYDAADIKKLLCICTTNAKGKWVARLSSGSYFLDVTMPSGVKKKFQMNIDENGDKKISEIKQQDTYVQNEKLTNGSGSEKVTDFILDAHGNGIYNVRVQAYIYNSSTDNYTIVCEDYTTRTGEFTLNLDKGKYKFVISCDRYKTNEQIIII